MKKIIVCFVLFLIEEQLYSQTKNETRIEVIPNTNITIQLPKEFKKSTNPKLISGFIDSSDNCQINGLQLKSDLNFQEAVTRQIESLEYIGLKVDNVKDITNSDMSTVIIEYNNLKEDNFKGLILIFGKQNFQNIITSTFPKNRYVQILDILKTAKLDMEIIINNDNNLGFSITNNSGKLNEINRNAAVINYEDRNELKEIQTKFSVGKIPSKTFRKVRIKRTVNFFGKKNFPNQKVLDKEKFILKNEFTGLKKTYTTINAFGKPQFNFIAFIKLKDFDLLFVGSAMDINNFHWMEEIIHSIELL